MSLRGNYRYYQKNSERFIQERPGEFVVIANREAQGFYPTMHSAYCAAINEKKLKKGKFLVHQCVHKQPANSALYYFCEKK